MDGLRKWGDVGVLRIVVAVFGGDEGLDFEQSLKQAVRKFVSSLQDGGEGIEIGLIIGARIGKEVFGGQKVGETFEKLGEERPADLTENVGVGKEFKRRGVHERV